MGISTISEYLLILTRRQVVSWGHVESWPTCEAYRDLGPDASPLRPDRASDSVAPHRIGAPALRPRRRRAAAADRDAAAARLRARGDRGQAAARRHVAAEPHRDAPGAAARADRAGTAAVRAPRADVGVAARGGRGLGRRGS